MRLIVFDVDGTLVDSGHYIHAAMTEAFEAAGQPGPALAEVHRIIGLSLPVALARLRPALPPETVERIAGIYRNSERARHLRDLAPLFPGARACLETLAARDDLILGIATGKGRRGLDALLEHHRLSAFFATLQCADDHPSKPHPAMLHAAMAEAGVAPERTMMVGDTTFDVEMALAAGALGMGVAWGYHPPEALREAGAADVAPDYEALSVMIEVWAA